MLETSIPVSAFNYEDKDQATPNYWQTQPGNDFVNNGKMYCGPTATSNSLMWLGEHGFPNLIPSAPDAVIAQGKMIDILASNDYMQTGDHNGTKLPNVIHGIEQYIENSGYALQSLQYQGISKCPAKYLAGSPVDLNWVAENIKGSSGEILGIGWYKYDPLTDVYKRVGGHYLTVVGCETNESDDRFPCVLLVHNPAIGKSSKLYVEQIQTGILIRPSTNAQQPAMTRSAAGLYKVVRGLDPRKLGIIEGAIVFKL